MDVNAFFSSIVGNNGCDMLSYRTKILVSEAALRDKITNKKEVVLKRISSVQISKMSVCRQVHTLCSRPRKGIKTEQNDSPNFNLLL